MFVAEDWFSRLAKNNSQGKLSNVSRDFIKQVFKKNFIEIKSIQTPKWTEENPNKPFMFAIFDVLGDSPQRFFIYTRILALFKAMNFHVDVIILP